MFPVFDRAAARERRAVTPAIAANGIASRRFDEACQLMHLLGGDQDAFVHLVRRREWAWQSEWIAKHLLLD